ncbi:condensin-2 complex subunit D3 [Acomys russatus]|uniref:condensin-2 complex subunit D3 n=1 Tax=Acomys russatus TaxID=60746 RepID=UPI0021E2589A|nr:condensin-2 complex subunit D3 [Acomys russatus]
MPAGTSMVAMALQDLGRDLQPWCPLDLSVDWVNTVWELDFTETEPLDPRIVAEILETGTDAFTKLYGSLFPFATDENGSLESIWTFFIENNISSNTLVALLCHFVQEAHKKDASAQYRECGLLAAGLYFLLLEVPGSIVNQVFHPVMFDKCIQILKKSWPQDSNLNQKRKKEQPRGSKVNHRRGRKRGKPPRKEDYEVYDLSEEEEEEMYFSARDLSQIRNAIFHLLKSFLRLLPKFSLKEKPQSIQTCIEVFVALTNFEPVPHKFVVSQARNLNEAKHISELAYYGLYLLCSPLHGEGTKVIGSIFHQMLNIILMLEAGKRSHCAPLTITSHAINCRNQAVQFISSLVDELRETVFPVLGTLLQHICAQVVDKAEYRTYAAQSLVQLLSRLPSVEYASFLAWLYKYSRSCKIPHRVFTLDVALALLELPEREVDDTVFLEHQKFLKHKFIVQEIILDRCLDKAPTVRSKALSSFAHCLELPSNNTSTVFINSEWEGLEAWLGAYLLAVWTAVSCFPPASSPGILGSSLSLSLPCSLMFTKGNLGRELGIFLPWLGKELGGSEQFIQCSPKHFASQQLCPVFLKAVTLWCRSTERSFMTVLRKRTKDEKTNVRKSALQVLMNILKHCDILGMEEDLLILQDHCRDPAISVRKQALQSLTELVVAQPTCVPVQKAWLMGVIPVVMDCETTVQEKALECLDQLLLQNIKHHKKFHSEDRSQVLAWALLALLTIESQDLSRYLNKAFHIWSKKDKFSSAFINSVISHTDTERSAPAWMLLSKITCSSPKLDYTKIMESWERLSREQSPNPNTLGYMLCVIGQIAKHLPRSTRDRITGVVKGKLTGFQWSLELISSSVDTLQGLCRASAKTLLEEQELLKQVCADVLSTCEHHLSNVLLKENGPGNMDEDLVVKYIFTIGDIAQLCPAIVEKRIFLLIQSILASSAHADQLPSSQGTTDNLASELPFQVRSSAMPSVIRAHAIITLGKLCLQHEDLAKKSIPALVRELEVCEDVAVRNNVIIVMCDLCIRYTVMVDNYIPNISICLKDSDPFIRKQTLILLTNLLQEEYVKWKGSLFFRFVSTLVDSHPEIASLGEFCLAHVLLKRSPSVFSQHFIECIFHFNSYEKHEQYNRFSQSERGKQLFLLKGKTNKEKRMRIYKFLLEHFTDEQRFNVTSKICLSILACFTDGVLPLDMEASELLSDTFDVLSSKEIKLLAMRAQTCKDLLEEDDMALANVVMQEAQMKIISQVQKRNFIENIIPIIISLKTVLEKNKIPALRELMNYLREVMQDYRDEIKDFFAVDKQLAAELEYDMKKYTEQLAQEQALAGHADVTKTPEGGDRAQAVQVAADLQAGLAAAAAAATATTATASQENAAVSPAKSRPLAPGSSFTAALPPISENGPLKIMPNARSMSLSTIAILNSVKKAVESKSRNHRRSLGALPFNVDTGSPEKPCSHASSLSLDQESDRPVKSVTNRAISTPEKSISDITFGAGVSYIGTPSTLSFKKEKIGAQDEERDILCLSLPDKSPPQSPQWNVKSLAGNKGNPRSSRRTLRKAPLKTAN